MKILKLKGQWAVCLSALLLGISSLSSLQASCHNSSSSSSESANCSSLVINKRTNESFENLQAAIDAAESGDVLKLRGKFEGSFQIIDKSLTLKGSQECETVLDGNNNGRVLTILGEFNLILDIALKNLVIRHGLTSESGGGIASAFANLTLDQVKVTKNTASSLGGGISFSFGSLTILNSAITHNSSATGGGIYDVVSASLVIRNSKIKHNQATSDFGGGIFLAADAAEIVNSDISHNQTFLAGGGLFNGHSLAKTKIQNCKMNENEASYGGGIYNIGNLEIIDSEINDNECLTSINENSGKGGGIFNDSGELIGLGSVTLRRSIVEGNKVSITGGGIFSRGNLLLKKTRVKENQPNDIVQEEEQLDTTLTS